MSILLAGKKIRLSATDATVVDGIKATKEAHKVEVPPSVAEAAERVLKTLEESLQTTVNALNGTKVKITCAVDAQDLRRLALFLTTVIQRKGRARRAAQSSAQP